MTLKTDNFRLGLVLGLILPLFVFYIIYLVRFSSYPFDEFQEMLLHESRLITFFSVWCLLANIGLFTLFINTNRYATAKGVFLVTVFYGVLFLLTKVIT